MNVLMPLFSPPTGTWGSLTRVMALAGKFREKNHDVAFCAAGFVAQTLRDKGFKVYEVPQPTILGLPRWLSGRISARAQNAAIPVREGKSVGNIWLLYFFTGLSKKKTLTALVEAELAAAKDFNADLLVTEMDPGAYLAAYLANMPIVTTYAKIATLGKGTLFWKKMRRSMRHVLRKNGITRKIDPEDIVFRKEVIKLIPSIPELDTTDPAQENVIYAGNLLEPIRATKEAFVSAPGKKYVFCYFGTGSLPLSAVQNVLPETFKNRDDIVCYVASQGIARDFSIGNVEFVNYIQASELLPHCVMTICHGGLNTITQSIEAGVPLLVFPGPVFERRFNALRVQETNAGFFGELGDFNPDWIIDKLAKIESRKTNIVQLQKSFRSYRGTETAYNAIMKALGQ